MWLNYLIFWIFLLKIFFGGKEEKFSTKNKKRFMTFTHKNKNEKEIISCHDSTYFPTFYTTQIFFFFSYYYQTEPK